MLLQAVVTVLCGVGLYASLFMLGKARRAERGELAAPSVVLSPRARLFGGVSNAAIGCLYYPALAAAIWFVRTPAVGWGVLGASALAAVTSLALAWSLLFVTRRWCAYCWTAHTINWTLAALACWSLAAGTGGRIVFPPLIR